MNKEELLKKLEGVLEMENITETSAISLSSLQTLTFVAFVDDNYNKQLSAEELKSLSNNQTVADLISLIGVTF